MLGVSLALTAFAVVLDKTVGEHIMIDALLYSSFFIALTVSSRDVSLQPYSRTARTIIICLGSIAWYGFFLAVAALNAVT